MNVRRELSTGSTRSVRLAVVVLVASLVSVFLACLPSVQFESPGADGGADGPAPDGAQPTDGAADGPGDAAMDGDSAADVTPMPDTGPAFGPMASSPYYVYGETAACIVRAGTLYCWGDVGSNANGQLGFPDENAGGDAGILHPTAVTTTVQPASQLGKLVMSSTHTCALYGPATYCWGDNYEDELGSPTVDGGPTEVPVIGLPQGGLTAIAATSLTTCGLAAIADAGGTSNVYCWGYNGSGELGRPVQTATGPTAQPVTGDIDGGPRGLIPDALLIAGGGYHFCALTSDGRILCWGATGFLESGPTQGPSNCPGNDSPTCTPQAQQVTLPAGETPVGLALGDLHSCALTQAGNVYCWGSNALDQLGTPASGQICPYGGDLDAGCTGVPVPIGVTHVKHLFAGGSTTCAIDDSRHAFCWGNNADGELAQGNDESSSTAPEVLDPVTGNPYTFDDMALGRYSVCGRDGSQVYCWGAGVLGTQTDAGQLPNPYYPALVPF